MNNVVLQAIADRRSNRGYADTQLTEEQLQAIMTAALEAPSAQNSQPWHFTICQDKALLDAFSDEYSRLTRPEKSGYHLFFHAPTVIFISTPIEAPSKFSQVDCGIAVQNIALAAHSLGLGSVILGRPIDVFLSDRGEEFSKALAIPSDYKFAIGISLGNATLSKSAHVVREGMISRV